MKKIFVLILNFNGYKDTKKCLVTLHNLFDKMYQLNTVVIDNGSSKKELRLLKDLLTKYPPIILLENGKNLGFAAGNNVGIRYALLHGADYVLLLNNDTVVTQEFLSILMNGNGDITAPVISYKSSRGKWVYDYGGKINWWTGRTTHVEYNNAATCLPARQVQLRNNDKEIDYVSGCCMLVKREVFKRIGFFDEKFFFYFEDADFCVRAKQAGYHIFVHPEALITHTLGGSIGKWTNKAIYFNLCGNLLFIIKHLKWRIPVGLLYLTALTGKIVWDKLWSTNQPSVR